MITILGAGLAGISCSYHIGHQNCEIYEAKNHAGGHIYSHHHDGFTWDEGPHVSFTKHEYVKELFSRSTSGGILEYAVEVMNYYAGAWIPHPAQSNLYAVPAPLRDECYSDFVASRSVIHDRIPENYAEWLESAFGKAFARSLPSLYTRKYWTRNPSDLATDWVGGRIHAPDIGDVKRGYEADSPQKTHYIQTVRYPASGGFSSFASGIVHNANIHFNHGVTRIDLEKKKLWFTNGTVGEYTSLINTIPLPEFVNLAGAPPEILHAASELECTSLLLVNIVANHPTKKSFHWLYVYDEQKYSCRVNCVEMLSPGNGVEGKTGVQVEVYAVSARGGRPHAEIAKIVCDEMIEIGLIDSVESVHTQFVNYANVIFDHRRRTAQEKILKWLEKYGLQREVDDLDPMTDWTNAVTDNVGEIALAGRFGQWKYFWTDDCVLRGRQLASAYRGE